MLIDTMAALLTIAVLSTSTVALSTGRAFVPSAFITPTIRTKASTSSSTSSLSMSFFADSSDYKGDDFSDDPSSPTSDSFSSSPLSDQEVESPVTEETPVPMSKNNHGNRWIALVFDRALDKEDRDVTQLHARRIAKTQDHVLFCRMANLYNETFNYNSMVDVLWSYPILSSDLHRSIGHAICLDCPSVEEIRSFLSRDPITRLFASSNEDASEEEKEEEYLEIANSIPLYRWRHIRDHSLRIDDGRNGSPTLILGLDHSAVEDGKGKKKKSAAGVSHPLREQEEEAHFKYLITSERVIAAGPLHLPTPTKEDDASIPVGDLILFNAPTREEAIEFAENDPYAQVGLYETLRVHRYNQLDVTGKFVAEDLMYPGRMAHDMKIEMRSMGYPVEDDQTKWINW